MRRFTLWRVGAAFAALSLSFTVLVACGSSSSGDGTSGKEVVLATHDSWAAPKELLKKFESESGYRLKVTQLGDAGELTNKLVLTKGNPVADAVFGIDNTFASRATDEGVVAGDLTPIDWGDVCVNVDDAWFASHNLAAPQTLDDLVLPAYKGLFVTPGATTSSPGFAFLLATIGRYGDGWKQYWTKLIANDAKIDGGWSDAWNVDYTAGGGKGTRPIVLSYNTSPVDTIPKGGSKPTTHALLDTCFRQTEYAGVLKGAKNVEGARALVAFLRSTEFQESLPDNMYVFPVDAAAKLPAAWTQWAPKSPNPIDVPAAEIDKNRQTWLTQWSDVTSR